MAKETKEKILKAARELFGERGFDNVSVREITKRAEVNLSALSYHFIDKDGLVSAVLDQSFDKINQTRRKLLEKALLDSSDNPSLRQVLEAFVAPVFLPEIHQTDPRLVASLTSRTLIHDEQNNPYNASVFLETVQLFLNVLSKTLPGKNKEQIRSILKISSGAAIAFRSFAYNESGKISLEASAEQHTTQLNLLLDYIQAGTEAALAS